jgi:hypothetical protein
MLDTTFMSRFFRINPVFNLSAYVKCPIRPPLGKRSLTPDYSRFLIIFFCRLLKIHALIHSVVCTRFGALECADIVPEGEAAFAEHPEGTSRHQPHLHCTKRSAVQVCRRHREAHCPRRVPRGSPWDESAALRGRRISRSPSAGRLTRAAFTRHPISFSCRLPKIHALNHSVVCTRFGALDSSRFTSLSSPSPSAGRRVVIDAAHVLAFCPCSFPHLFFPLCTLVHFVSFVLISLILFQKSNRFSHLIIHHQRHTAPLPKILNFN